FFFFQGEDGIRAFHVTGVQTCALPILVIQNMNEEAAERKKAEDLVNGVLNSSISGIIAFRSIRNDEGNITDFEIILANPSASRRSEERRGGAESGDVRQSSHDGKTAKL